MSRMDQLRIGVDLGGTKAQITQTFADLRNLRLMH